MNRTRASKVNTTQWYNSSSLFLNRVAPSLVHDYAGQRYYNTTNGETSFPFTATRTTNAMQFDSQGRLIFAPANLLTRSDPSTAVVGSPGTAPTGWSITLGLSNGVTRSIVAKGVQEGIPYIDFQLTGTFTTLENITVTPAPGPSTVTANPGESFTGSIFWNVISGTLADAFALNLGGVRIRYGNPGLLAQEGSRNVAIYTWQRDFKSSIAPASTTAVGTDWVWSFNAGQVVNVTVRIGAMQLERTGPDSPKSYNITEGSAYYGPRFDYEPFTHEPLGLQVEDSRTNLVPISMGYDATTFAAALSALAATKSGSPVTYLGGWAAARYVPDGTNQGHGAFPHSITPSASVKISLQAIVAPISGGTFFQMTGSGAWLVDVNGYANFDLSGAGSITATGASAEAVFVRRLDTNVYHIGITVTTSAAPGAGATSIVAGLLTGTETRLQPVIGGPTFDYIYGAHFQGQIGHSSMIPSFGVATTRAADVVNVNTGSWLNQTRGTMYADFVRGFVATGSGATQIPAALVEGATTYLAFTSGFGTHNTHRFDTVVAGANQAQLTTASGVTQFTTRKMIGSYTANDFKACENNGTVATDVSGTIPTAVTSLQIGSIVSGNFLNGWVKEFRYYADNSATGPQLQAATTVVLLLMASAALLASSDGFLFSVIA